MNLKLIFSRHQLTSTVFGLLAMLCLLFPSCEKEGVFPDEAIISVETTRQTVITLENDLSVNNQREVTIDLTDIAINYHHDLQKNRNEKTFDYFFIEKNNESKDEYVMEYHSFATEADMMLWVKEERPKTEFESYLRGIDRSFAQELVKSSIGGGGSLSLNNGQAFATNAIQRTVSPLASGGRLVNPSQPVNQTGPPQYVYGIIEAIMTSIFMALPEGFAVRFNRSGIHTTSVYEN